ncbi:MAG: hypothetical protein IJ642_09925 [Oscillospiraceae bacterium]|nr:hypothetical protein [Oscillospiraceae bacterium]
MNVENLQFLSRIALIVSIAALLLSVLMFFLFHIPRLFNELTGRAEKKFIAEAQKKNEAPNEEASPGTSGALLSSELISESLNGTVQKVSTTTKLTPTEGTARLNIPAPIQEEQLRSLQPDPAFRIVTEFAFTSSTELIE